MRSRASSSWHHLPQVGRACPVVGTDSRCGRFAGRLVAPPLLRCSQIKLPLAHRESPADAQICRLTRCPVVAVFQQHSSSDRRHHSWSCKGDCLVAVVQRRSGSAERCPSSFCSPLGQLGRLLSHGEGPPPHDFRDDGKSIGLGRPFSHFVTQVSTPRIGKIWQKELDLIKMSLRNPVNPTRLAEGCVHAS